MEGLKKQIYDFETEKAAELTKCFLKNGYSQEIGVDSPRDWPGGFVLEYAKEDEKAKEKFDEVFEHLMKVYNHKKDRSREDHYLKDLINISTAFRIPYTEEFLNKFKKTKSYEKLGENSKALIRRSLMTFGIEKLNSEEAVEWVKEYLKTGHSEELGLDWHQYSAEIEKKEFEPSYYIVKIIEKNENARKRMKQIMKQLMEKYEYDKGKPEKKVSFPVSTCCQSVDEVQAHEGTNVDNDDSYLKQLADLSTACKVRKTKAFLEELKRNQ